MRLHPIMYVPDQYAERSFYEAFGFATRYEGDEFPGFLAIAHGEAVIGLQRASEQHSAYSGGLRWQFEVDTGDEIDGVLATCAERGLTHELVVEHGGGRFRTRIVRVVAPSGAEVWFEGPNEA